MYMLQVRLDEVEDSRQYPTIAIIGALAAKSWHEGDGTE